VLAKKLEGTLVKTIVTPAEALEFSGERGAILSLSASWHRTVEKDEKVDMAEFMFLMAKEGKPVQVEINYEDGKFKKVVTDLAKEMGDVSDEGNFACKLKLLSDCDILDAIGKDGRVVKAMKKAKHLRVYSMDFVVYDEDYQAPVWHVLLKNWPLTNHFKREKPLTVETVVEATRGKIVTLTVYST
jgi:hypothetical protein